MTSCVVGGATIPISTQKHGSVTANFTGVAMCSVINAASGQRNMRVNRFDVMTCRNIRISIPTNK